jgi:hypothetical protein
LGPTCHRFLPRGKRWPPCCTPCGGSRGRQEPQCRRHCCCREGAQLAAAQGPTFDAGALPRRPLSPPTERASAPTSPKLGSRREAEAARSPVQVVSPSSRRCTVCCCATSCF